jgi:Ion channel
MQRRLIELVKRIGTGNFHVLLVLLLLGILLEGYAHESQLARRISAAGVGLVILTSVRVVASSTTTRLTGRGVVLVWLCVRIPSMIWGGDPDNELLIDVFARYADVLSFGWILGSLVIVLLRMRRVDARMLSASLCAYLMLGIWFYGIYKLLPEESFTPPASEVFPQGHDNTRGDLFYFSFVTLTSLGYGDVSPVSPIARSIAILEVVLGQFFLAVLIARQVGMFLVTRSVDEGSDKRA